MPTQVIHATGLTGLFRVVAIGQLTLGAPFDPRIKVLFRRVNSFEGSAKGHARANYGQEMVSLPVPIGEMLSLGIGTTLDCDHVIEAPDILEFDIAVDFRQGLDGCLTRNELQERGLLAPLRGGPAVEDVCPEDSWWYLAPCLDPGFGSALFPASLLYTTYYAPTSRLAARILAGDANDLSLTLVDSGKSRPINSEGHAEIHLRRGVLRAEAIAIARAWYDPAFHERMSGIHGNVAASAISGAVASLCVAPPPMAGTVRLRVKALTWRTSLERQNLVVLSILDSDERLPFQTLDAHLDQTKPNDEVSEENHIVNPVKGRKPASDFLSLFCKLDGNDSQPGESPPKVVVVQTPTVCFSALSKLSVKRRERNQSTNHRKPLDSKTSTNTTRQQAGRRGNPDNQQTTLSHIDANRSSDDVEEESKTPQDALDGLIQAVRYLGEDFGIGVTSRVVTANAFGYQEFVLNELQKPEDVRSPNWYLLAGTQLARPVLMLELRIEQRHALLVEIVRNPGEQFSSLCVAKDDRGAFSDAELRSLLSLIEAAQQIPKNIEVSAAVGGDRDHAVDVRRFRHGADLRALAERIALCLDEPAQGKY